MVDAKKLEAERLVRWIKVVGKLAFIVMRCRPPGEPIQDHGRRASIRPLCFEF